MNCFSRNELQEYLSQELAAETEARVEEHVTLCTNCGQTLDVLASDPLVQEYFESLRRDTSDRVGEATVSMVAILPASTDGELPDWQPFSDGLQLPLQFGMFVLKRILGSGGFGVVYLADDMNLNREVAVKIPHLGGLSPDVRRRFVQEGTASANLHHPHIVQVHHAATHQGVYFLVSEYCPGRTLRQLLDERDGVGSVQHAARIMLSLAEAVEHAHQSGIVHRDIKPANVILDDRSDHRGLPYCPRLADFGTAKFVGADQSMTSSGMLIGTAPYMAPEQVSGNREVGPACDVYALGVLLYELIAGQRPIQGSDSAQTISKIVSFDPLPLHRKVPGTSRDISAICACCLEKSLERRYASAEELASDLRRFLNNAPTRARPLGPGTRLVRWSRRNPLLMSIMAMICVVFALIFGGLALHAKRLGAVNARLAASNRNALELRDRAEQTELHTRHLRYASDMRLAETLWRRGEIENVREILDRYVPSRDEGDLRGIEWYFLERRVQSRAEVLVTTGSPLYCLRLSPDQEQFATAGEDGVIRIHDRVTGAVERSIESEQGEVNSVAFSPDGQTLASAGDDGSVRLWRLADGKQLGKISAHDGLAFGVQFTPDARHLVSCGTDNLVHVWKNDPQAAQREATYRDHSARVEAIAVSPDGRWLASVGKDRSLFVRDVRTGKLQLKWDQGEGPLSSVMFSLDSKTVAIAEAGGNTKWLRLFDVVSGVAVLKREHPDGINTLAFSPDGNRVVTADNEGVVRIWSVKNDDNETNANAPQCLWQPQAARSYSATFEPNAAAVLTVGKDGQVWRLHTGQMADENVFDRNRLSEMTGLDEENFEFHSVAFHPVGKEIFVAADTGIAVLQPNLNEAPQFQLRRGNNSWRQIAAPPKGDWIAVAGSSSPKASEDGLSVPAVVERWETAKGPSRVLLRTESNCSVRNLSCSPSGDMLAVVVSEHLTKDQSKQLLLLDSETGEILRTFPASAGTKPRFTPDGQLLVFGVQKDLHFFDLHNQKSRIIRNAHASSQGVAAISRNGKWLASCDEGRDLGLWNVATLQQHAILDGHNGKLSALQFSSDSRTLLSSSYDGTVIAWSVATGQQLMNLHLGSVGVSYMALSPDGSRLAVVEDQRRIRVYLIGREDR